MSQLCPVCASPVREGDTTCRICGAPLSAAAATASVALPAGCTLAGGQYVLNRVLGQGGFGITYDAQDVRLGLRVAVKELFVDGSQRQVARVVAPTRLSTGEFQDTKKRFLDEAKVLARFNDPGIVRVLNYFEENGTAYLVMEFLEGMTLGGAIEKNGPLPPAVVLEIARSLAQTLEQVHGAGLLHRDIKPDNVFMHRSGRIVLIDFGSVRAFAPGQTVSHTRLVTPGYAPLEQYGNSARYGPYTDIYALGATLHHALTGTMPPPATDLMLGTPLPPLPAGTPAPLRRAIEQSMSLRVEDRPQTARALEELLVGPLQGVRTAAPPAPTPRTPGASAGAAAGHQPPPPPARPVQPPARQPQPPAQQPQPTPRPAPARPAPAARPAPQPAPVARPIPAPQPVPAARPVAPRPAPTPIAAPQPTPPKPAPSPAPSPTKPNPTKPSPTNPSPAPRPAAAPQADAPGPSVALNVPPQRSAPPGRPARRRPLSRTLLVALCVALGSVTAALQLPALLPAQVQGAAGLLLSGAVGAGLGFLTGWLAWLALPVALPLGAAALAVAYASAAALHWPTVVALGVMAAVLSLFFLRLIRRLSF